MPILVCVCQITSFDPRGGRFEKKGNLGRNPEEKEREGTETKERGVYGLMDAQGWDLKTV